MNIRQSTSPDLRQPNNFDTSINQKISYNLVAPPIFSGVLGDKLSNSSSRDLYTRCRMNLAEYLFNIPAPKFVDLGLSAINALDKSASLWTSDTRVGKPMGVAHGSAPDHIFENFIAVRYEVGAKSDYSYKTDFYIWGGG